MNFRLRVATAALLVIASTVLACVAPADATFPGTNGRIVYEDGNGTTGYIWTIRPDGSGSKKLVQGGMPKWSKDGKRIAFVRNTAAYKTDIFTMNADGSNVQQVTKTGNNTSVGWSPDGKRLVFASRRTGHAELYIVNSTKPYGTAIRITKAGPVPNVGRNTDNSSPDWSPDGKMILFERHFEDYDAPVISTVQTDGTHVEVVSLQRCADLQIWEPRWGPGMRRIAYGTDDHNGFSNPLVCTATYRGASGAPTNVTGDPAFSDEGVANWIGSWSPDGLQMVFYRRGDGPAGIYTHASNGTGMNKLVVAGGYSPDWGTAP